MDKELEKIVARIEAGRQFRRCDWRPELRTAGDGEESLIIEGHATTFDEEYDLYSFDDWDGYRVTVAEKVDRNAFANTDMSDVIFLYDHRGRVMARSRNGSLTVKPDNTGLFTRADLSKAEFGPGLYRDIKNGLVDRMSMQFTVKKDKREEFIDKENKTMRIVRTILDVGKLYDVSAVGIPANDGTDISARSFADGVIRELEAERLEASRKATRAKALSLSIELTLEEGENKK